MPWSGGNWRAFREESWTRHATGPAAFDAARANSASVIRDDFRDSTSKIGAGVVAECEVTDGKIAGIAVSIGVDPLVACRSRRGARVSSTGEDLVAGSGIRFDDRGEHQLKGVPDAWRLFAAAH